MRKGLQIVLGLALLLGALGFAGYRYIAPQEYASKVSTASRKLDPQASRGGKQETMSSFQMLELALNVANVLVGAMGIWFTMRGMRAERRADAMALRRDR